MIKKFFKWLTTILLVLVLLLAVASVFMQVRPFEKMPWIKGYKPLTVLGGSMEPAIHVGSVVLVSPVEVADIEEGDIITFKTPQNSKVFEDHPGSLTTHRVTEVINEGESLGFKTKGDANDSPDGWIVPAADVLGKAGFSIPYVGYFINFARTRNGFLLLVILPAALIIIGEIWNIFKCVRESEKGGKAPESDSEAS
ncbi:MAG: signal peptidase I [Actinomycetota bacterium]|nr:signal peptidase I [Actinomycetota bacterium]